MAALPGREVFGLCFFCSVIILLPILTLSSWYHASQAYRYPYLLVLFKEQFLAGNWYPRWLPGLMGGYGYPTFVFYPPGFWFLALPAALLFKNALLAVKVTVLLLLIAGGIGAYRLARCFCNANTAILAMITFYLTPELAHLLYDTGDFAELTAMMLCPWVFYHLLIVSDRIKHEKPCLPNALWLAVSLAAVVYAHAIVTVWLSVALLLCVIGCAWDSHKFMATIKITALSGLLAMALSSPYWFPSLLLGGQIDYGTSLYVFSIQSMPFKEIFAFTSDRAGMVLPLLAAAGFFYGWRSRFMMAALLCSILCIFYILPLSLPLRSHFSILRYLQDPQRVLPVLATLQLVGIAFLLGYAELRWTWPGVQKAGMVVISLLMLAASDHYNLRGFMNYHTYYHSRPWEFEDMTNTREFKPKKANISALVPRARNKIPIAAIARPSPARFTGMQASTQNDVRLQLVTTGITKVIFNQFYFPGWKITGNGIPAQACPRASKVPYIYCVDKHGLMNIHIRDAGTHNLHIWYDGVPLAHWRNIIAFFTALACIAALRRFTRPQAISA